MFLMTEGASFIFDHAPCGFQFLHVDIAIGDRIRMDAVGKISCRHLVLDVDEGDPITVFAPLLQGIIGCADRRRIGGIGAQGDGEVVDLRIGHRRVQAGEQSLKIADGLLHGAVVVVEVVRTDVDDKVLRCHVENGVIVAKIGNKLGAACLEIKQK